MPPTPPAQVAQGGQFQRDRFIRDQECSEITGLSRTTRWRLEKKGMFPPRRQISANAVAWLESEVRDWMASKMGTV